MTQVFVSYGTPDKEAVRRVVDRLRLFALDVWWDEDRIDGTASIPEQLIDQIDTSCVAVICLSDQSVDRKWIERETTLCWGARRRGNLKGLIPIQVGPLQLERVSEFLIDQHIRDLCDTIQFERNLCFLINDICRPLYGANPDELPSVLHLALFAMTNDQCSTLVEAPQMAKALVQLCAHMGMKEVEIRDLLAQRYGDASSDYVPFGAESPLVKIVHDSVSSLNTDRDRRRRILPRWMRDDLFSQDLKIKTDAREAWEAGPSLAIIDSLSIQHPDVQEQLAGMPHANKDRTAVLWLPPYTEHMACVENLVQDHIQTFPAHLSHVQDCFAEWTNKPHLWRAFDLGSNVMVKQWIYHFCAQGARCAALPHNIAAPAAQDRQVYPEKAFEAFEDIANTGPPRR